MKTTDELFKKAGVKTLGDNFFRVIDDEWMLITAGDSERFNTMTASWGGIGVLWNKTIAICFIRKTRYTFDFANACEYFTLSFFSSKERNMLNICGSTSGRDTDKIAATGLLPVLTQHGAITFEQSRLCFECRKIYMDDLRPENFALSDTDNLIYSKKDYHRMYIGEIVNCYSKG